ncbi:MAG: PepSY domain-containing protein [Pseudolabrys sp.]|nr:PepSY domain-containing protein [Pseudolabrys sp.]
MKNPNTLIRVAFTAALASAVLMPPMIAHAKTALASEARITMSEARAIALKAHPGKIMAEELEREDGGSGLRYSFDLKQGKQWREVGVDAMTGRVLENAAEGANPKD